jgi:hypothetical protein
LNFLDEDSVKINLKKSRIKPLWISEYNDEDSSDYENDSRESAHFSKDQHPDKVKRILPAKLVNKKLIKKHLSSESDDGNSSKSGPFCD